MKDDLGVDVPFNYKTQDVNDVLAEHGPVDFYWDMVGGKSFESAIEHTKTLGKIIVSPRMLSTSSGLTERRAAVRRSGWRIQFQRKIRSQGK